MLDENLPIFFIAEATDNIKHHASYYQTRGGGDPEPAYSLHHPDPASPNAQNCYAAALFDPYNPDVLYGEVLVRPDWSQPTLSAEEIRRNGGIAPPPEPLMPTEFTIQLYNPDQQIIFTRASGLLEGTHYDFSMPQDTFRAPSASMLDKSQNDPAAANTTPKINFSWKRESKLSKDLTCYVRGKSTDVIKKKSKEPDIAVAYFKSLKELTIYEPNLYRVEMQDAKGLEVVMLLSAAVIKEVYHGNMHKAFNISDVKDARRRSSSGTSKPVFDSPYKMSGANGAGPTTSNQKPVSAQQLPSLPLRPSQRPPPTDPRTQWAIDAETARLKAQTDAERREVRRKEEQRRIEREKVDEEEARRLRRMVSAEEKERRRKQKDVDKETERLRRLYGMNSQPGLQPHSAPMPQQPFLPPRPMSAQPYHQPQSSHQNHHSISHPQPAPSLGVYPQYPQQAPQPMQQQFVPNSQYARPTGPIPMSNAAPYMSGGAGPLTRPQHSNWNLNRSAESQSRLQKKSSSVW